MIDKEKYINEIKWVCSVKFGFRSKDRTQNIEDFLG